jgi:hypothetical protein
MPGSVLPVLSARLPTRIRLTRFRRVAAAVVIIGAVASIVPAALSAKQHAFSATYAGYGHGQVRGTSVSGSATLRGRGRLIGPSTLSGSAHGVFINSACVVWSGQGVLRSRAGSVALTAHDEQACAAADGNMVSFAGRAKVVGGTATFKGAHGVLAFNGTYLRQSGAVTISFKGQISY